MNIAVTLIVSGEFKNIGISLDMLPVLAEKFRTEGAVLVRTTEGEYEAQGIVIAAKGSKHSLMLIPEDTLN